MHKEKQISIVWKIAVEKAVDFIKNCGYNTIGNIFGISLVAKHYYVQKK